MCFHFLPGIPRTLTPEGLDLTFATNYIGPFLLTNLLQGKEMCLPSVSAQLLRPPGIFLAASFPLAHSRGTARHKSVLGFW